MDFGTKYCSGEIKRGLNEWGVCTYGVGERENACREFGGKSRRKESI
jgi:hypothetical protein